MKADLNLILAPGFSKDERCILVMGRVHFLRVKYESGSVEYGPSMSPRVSRDSLSYKSDFNNKKLKKVLAHLARLNFNLLDSRVCQVCPKVARVRVF